MNANYKHANDNKIEFVGQSTATVKTNKTTLQLPLLITKANNTVNGTGLDVTSTNNNQRKFRRNQNL